MSINNPASAADFFDQIPVLPRRLWLETPGVEATVPMLRGAWGAALHDANPPAYRDLFGDGDDQNGRPPGYLFRPAPPDPKLAPAVDFFLFGSAVEQDAACRAAWLETARRGLGKSRRPFKIRHTWLLGPAGSLVETVQSRKSEVEGPCLPRAGEGPFRCGEADGTRSVPATMAWPLSQAVWPLAADAPCQLMFTAPLRLRRHGRLIESPTLADLVVAACRRIELFLPEASRAAWKDYSATALELARARPQSAWSGARLDLHRWSARQQSEVDLHGVSGSLALPAGPGELAPLLAAGRWLHVGKGTVMGLGQFEVESPKSKVRSQESGVRN